MSYTVKVGSETIDIFNIIQKSNNTYAADGYRRLGGSYQYNDVNNVNYTSAEDLSFGRVKPFYGLKETDGNDIKGYHITNIWNPGVVDWSAHRAFVSTNIANAFKSRNNIQSSESIFDNTWAYHRIYTNTDDLTETFPTGCNKVTFICVGGGGGGGASARLGNRNSFASGGGGGGGVLLKIGTTIAGKYNNTYTVKAGTGGVRGHAVDPGENGYDSGNSGGDSYFKFVNQHWIAKGGGGGGGGRLAGLKSSKMGELGSGSGVQINFNASFEETATATWTGQDAYRSFFESDSYGGGGGVLDYDTVNDTHHNHIGILSLGGDAVLNNSDGDDAITSDLGGSNYHGGGGGGSGGNNMSKDTNTYGGNGSQGIVIVYFRYD